MNIDQLKPFLQDAVEKESLLFQAGEQASWWKRVRHAEGYGPMIDEVRKEGEALLSQEAPVLSYRLFSIFKERGTRLEYERVYFEKRKRLNTFAIMALLEPEREDYMAAIQETIWSILDEYTWCLPAHVGAAPESVSEAEYSLNDPSGWLKGNAQVIDLFSAETGFALSEIVTLMKDRLPLLLRNRMKHEVYRRIFWPYMQGEPFHWETATHNWASVCAGSIGAAALHLIGDGDELAAVLERVLRTMDCYLQGFEADGATTEGYGYWYYGFGFFVFFADLLKKRTGGSVNLFASEKVHQIALFQQKCFMSGTKVVNFSDSMPDIHIHMGLTHYLNRIYPDVAIPELPLRTTYTEDHCYRWATALRNIVWFREEKAAAGEPWDTATYYLEDAEWLISRHVNERGTFCFAAKGGHNAEPHNHNDLGHFILHADGETFLADLGCGMYTQQYFGAERYSYLCNASEGHSVPIIDGKPQREGAGYRAKVLGVSVAPDTERMELELAGAYGDERLRQLKRSFLWHKQEQPVLTMEDSYVFGEEPEQIVERFITMTEPDVSGEDLTIPGAGQRLIIDYDAKELQPHIVKLSFADHYGIDRDVYAIDFKLLHPKRECAVQFRFRFES
ncbi:Heparinase II/III-like protein [Paenibacillus konkukensis]|uniref:Heparinase II/III-like protein n=1 Tax=Paenibacillus konkukensis TaxID=2020716 RepID=A0ABY4RIQ8_9BACL|nr:heparinase II/III family protein [Paenibacillus konkukensis]UQZ81464.1 Heparinase II/III-like protein [Paenibacillus konkukensis]